MIQLIGVQPDAKRPKKAATIKPPKEVSKPKRSFWFRATKKRAAAIIPIKGDMPVAPKAKKEGKVKKVWKVICEEANNCFAAFALGRGYSCGEGSMFLSEEGALLREMAVQKARELKDKCARIKSAPRRIRGRFMIFLDSRRQVQPGANSLLRDADRVYLRKTLGLVQLRQLGEGANGAVFGGRFYYKRPDGVEKRIVVKV